ncbi:acyltransferase [Myxococcota bacterium]|nr:acyltransferase [Myxococcota bacterium]
MVAKPLINLPSFKDIQDRIHFWFESDRLGPDVPATHWMLFFKSTMLKLCKDKFLLFDESSEFRPGAYAVCCSKISIGKRVVIRPSTMLFADPYNDDGIIVIEDDVLIGSGVHIYVNNHKFDDPLQPILLQGHQLSAPVTLKRGCWIGANSILLKGVTIGENAVVGAGSVVTHSIPSFTVLAGIPARQIRKIRE